jgi:hypothetical protein
MPRPYSQKFMMELGNTDSNALGVQLAKLCVEANLPAKYVAVALETSRMTVHSWFRGHEIRKSKHKLITVFMDLVKQDMKHGRLPAKSHIDAKDYIQDMIGVEI